jgi:hypothetical protein
MGSYVIQQPSNPWARISEIAARVGVGPHAGGGGPATILVMGADGKNYDVFAVVAAVLDKIDAASNEEARG